MQKLFAALLAINPLAYLLALAFLGAASVVAGVVILAGIGWAFIASGVFLLSGAWFITRGMSQNG